MSNKQLKNSFLKMFYSKNYPKSWEKAFLKQCFLKGSMPPFVLYLIISEKKINWSFDGKDIWLSAKDQFCTEVH